MVVGKDTRRSSYMFESALVAGLVASGADAYLLHVIPTPGVAYETVDGRFDCGIMISASHNPYTDNGIKLVNGEGYKMDEDVLELIESYIDDEIDVAPCHRGCHWRHRGLHAGAQPLHRAPHCQRQLLAPGREGRPGLRERIGLLRRQARVRRPGRGRARDQQQP